MSTAGTEAQRLRLIRLAQADGLPARTVLKLAGAELDTLDGYPDATVLAYARALLATAERRAGRVPAGWFEAVHCCGCGRARRSGCARVRGVGTDVTACRCRMRTSERLGS